MIFSDQDLAWFAAMAVLGLFAGMVWLSGRGDERRWRRQREAEEAAHRAAE